MKGLFKFVCVVVFTIVGLVLGKVIRERKKYFIEGKELRKEISLLQDLVKQFNL